MQAFEESGSSESHSLNASGRSNASPLSTSVRSRKWPFFKKKMVNQTANESQHSSHSSLFSVNTTMEPESTHSHSHSEPPNYLLPDVSLKRIPSSVNTQVSNDKFSTSFVPEPISNADAHSSSDERSSPSIINQRKRSLTEPPPNQISIPAVFLSSCAFYSFIQIHSILDSLLLHFLKIIISIKI